MRVAALLLLVRYLGEASGDTGSLQRACKAVASIEASVAPVWRHRFEAHRAAFEHGLEPVDAAIALSQTLGPAEAVRRAVAHAELFEAEPAAWCIVDEPKPLGPSGRGFSYALLQSVAGLDEGALQSALERITEADILFVEGDGAQATYRFKHALIQDTAYDSLLKSRRQALHRRAAEILCECVARTRGDRVSFHRSRPRRSGDRMVG
jgi:hypothetical protein